MSGSRAVDLLVNCYERTYREVLTEETLRRITSELDFPFARRTLLVNNVDDRGDADRRAQAVIESGAADEVFHVEDHLDEALERTGLTLAELQPIPYFTDWAVVAVCLPGPGWMLHWDPELRMGSDVDWITPALELFERDPRVMVAGPHWGMPDDVQRQEVERSGPFSLGHGFSDHVFLIRRADFARPIYRDRSLVRFRYPLAHVGHIFEARVDAHLRRNGRLRAVHLEAGYAHPLEIGAAYPARKLSEKLRYVRNRALIRALQLLPWRPFRVRHIGR